MRRGVKAFLGLSLLLVATWAAAEDTRKKWQFGAGVSYWSTVDDIRLVVHGILDVKVKPSDS